MVLKEEEKDQMHPTVLFLLVGNFFSLSGFLLLHDADEEEGERKEGRNKGAEWR